MSSLEKISPLCTPGFQGPREKGVMTEAAAVCVPSGKESVTVTDTSWALLCCSAQCFSWIIKCLISRYPKFWVSSLSLHFLVSEHKWFVELLALFMEDPPDIWEEINTRTRVMGWVFSYRGHIYTSIHFQVLFSAIIMRILKNILTPIL